VKTVAPLVALLLAIAPAALAARTRAIHHPAVSCSFSLLPVWGNTTIAAAGQSRGMVFVYGQTAECAQWNAYSDVDWATIEAAPLDAQPAAYVTVAPNPTTATRSTTVIIAGIRLVITQEAGTQVQPNANLVVNGTFNTNLANWGWYERFPNGRGAVAWSPLDAHDSFSSGSIALRDDGPGLAFQQLQCMPAQKNTLYSFGAKVRTAAASSRGYGIIALFTYAEPDCSGEFTKQQVEAASPDEPGKWQEFSFVMETGSRTQAVLIVIASSATIPSFETTFDDVFVRTP
jgi:hypothetical protein